jgi:hypothetical protein
MAFHADAKGPSLAARNLIDDVLGMVELRQEPLGK